MTCDSAMLRTLAMREQIRDDYLLDCDPIATDRLRWRAQAFRHLVHLLPGESILEIGCGQGLFTQQLVNVTRERNPITAVTFHSGFEGPHDWPTSVETLRATVAQVDELTRYGAALNVFMLGDDPGLARFVDAVARRAGGRVFTPDVSRLGEYVVADYLRARRGRR